MLWLVRVRIGVIDNTSTTGCRVMVTVTVARFDRFVTTGLG